MASESSIDNQVDCHAVFNCDVKITRIEAPETKTTKGPDAPTKIMSHMSELSADRFPDAYRPTGMQQNEEGLRVPRGAEGVEGEPGEEEHHPLGPSALKFIEICPGYRSSGESSPAAAEGTKMHLAVEVEDFNGLNEEQTTQCGKALDYVKKLRKDASDVIKEKRLTIRYA